MHLGNWAIGKTAGGVGNSAASLPARPLFAQARAETLAEGTKNGYIALVAAVAPFLLAIILALGVGYFFAGFQSFSWSVPGIMAYGGGFTVEAVCLACFFSAAKAFWGGARWHFVSSLVGALLLSTISIAAQVLYLELDALKGAAHIPPGALDNVPIIGWLVGTNGGGWVVLGRAIGFHVAEAACCFILAKSTENPEKRIQAVIRHSFCPLHERINCPATDFASLFKATTHDTNASAFASYL